MLNEFVYIPLQSSLWLLLKGLSGEETLDFPKHPILLREQPLRRHVWGDNFCIVCPSSMSEYIFSVPSKNTDCIFLHT